MKPELQNLFSYFYKGSELGADKGEGEKMENFPAAIKWLLIGVLSYLEIQ